MSLFTDASLVVKPSLYKAGKLYSIKPGTGLGDLSVVRNSVKWGFGPNGVLRQVAANVPLIEYDPVTRVERGLLVEPGGTNLILRSQEFDNASWSKTDVTVTANNLVAPDGTTTGDTLTEGSAGTAATTQGYTVSSGVTVTQSLFFKYNNQQWIRIRLVDGANAVNAWVDIQNGVAGTISAAGTGVVGTVVVTNVGNGWFRCSMSGSIPATTSYSFHLFSAASNGSFSRTNGAIYGVWHAQGELGSVATSPMVTTSGTFNRVADVVSLTGASSLIGQNATGGTLYAEIEPRNTARDNRGIVSVGEAATNIVRLKMNGTGGIDFRCSVGGSATTLYSTATNNITTLVKIAVGYKNLDSAVYFNGSQVGVTNTSYTYPTVNLNTVSIGSPNFGVDEQFNGWIRSAVLFPIRKSNAELAAMTTL
jgi:hypothetical protein